MIGFDIYQAEKRTRAEQKRFQSVKIWRGEAIEAIS